ncbi:MAG TPA: hypothetical protein V6C72_10690 [Chroococcales cyanobacterium]
MTRCNQVSLHSIIVVIALTINWLPCSANSPAARDDSYASGVAEYSRGHYLVAVEKFKLVVQKQPGNQAAHYFYANSLAQTHNYPLALKEYEAGYNINPDSTVAASCLEALANLRDYASDPRSTPAGSAPPEGKSSPDKPFNEDNVLDTTRFMRHQVESEQSTRSDQASEYSKQRMEQAAREAKRIRDDAQRDIDNLPYVRRGSYRNMMRNQIQQESERQTKERMDKARADAAYFDKEARDRQAALSDVQNSLESQLKNPGSKSKLVPEGTNIYIRNYSH